MTASTDATALPVLLKLTVTLRAALMETVQDELVPVQAPPQVSIAYPTAGVATSVTEVPFV
jgi:hypothetical protein